MDDTGLVYCGFIEVYLGIDLCARVALKGLCHGQKRLHFFQILKPAMEK